MGYSPINAINGREEMLLLIGGRMCLPDRPPLAKELRNLVPVV